MFTRLLRSVCVVVIGIFALASIPHAQSGAVIPASKNDRWMTALAAAYPSYGELELGEALFPGSHDAGAYSLSSAYSPDSEQLLILPLLQLIPWLPTDVLIPSIRNWSTAQEHNLGEQLERGVRYLDLRLCVPSPARETVSFCHGLYGESLDTGLNRITTFLQQPGRSKEIVILHFTLNLFDDALTTSTAQAIRNKIGSHMYPVNTSNGASDTLQDVWNSGKQVIVLYSKSDSDGFWSTDRISSPWPGNMVDIPTLKDTVVQKLQQGASSDKFFVLQTQGTPDVIKAISDTNYNLYQYGGLEGLANATNPVIFPAVLNKAHENLNIVEADFSTRSGLVEAMINLTIAKLDLVEHKLTHRAYLSRAESLDSTSGAVSTSWNGTQFAYSSPIKNGTSAIGGAPAVAHFGNKLYAGDLRVTSIADDFLTANRTWSNGSSFAVNLNEPGTTISAMYAQAYDRLYVASTLPYSGVGGSPYVRWSADGTTFSDKLVLTNATTPSVPVLATQAGRLYIAWKDPNRFLHYGLITSEGTFTEIGIVASNVWARPAMTGFGGQLIFAWSDTDDKRIRLRWVDAANPANMSTVWTLPDDTTEAPPALAVFKGSVILAYTGRDAKRYTLVSPNGVDFVGANRSVQVQPVASNTIPPTLYAWGDRAIVSLSDATKLDGTKVTSGMWTNQPVNATVTCDAPVAGVYGLFVDGDDRFFEGDSVGISIEGDGQTTRTVTCLDLSGYAATATVGVQFDQIPPIATFVSSVPAVPPSGWLKEDVVATFSCSDAQSGPVSATVKSTLSSEGSFMAAVGECVDNAGNRGVAASTISFSIDKTPPSVSIVSRSPAANANGWNNTPVVVSYQVTDALSGVVGAASGMVTFNTDDRNQQTNLTVTDVAGNSVSVIVKDPNAAINIDTIAPILDVPADISIKKNGPGPFAVAYSVSAGDERSGMAASPTCDHPSGSNFPEGVTTVTCTAVDKAGNVATETFNVTVVINKAPEIASVSGRPIDEGASAAIAVAAADLDGDTMTYEFDCNGDGIFETTPMPSNMVSCAFDDNGTHMVNVRVTDDLGASTTSAVAVTVNNVAPTAMFSNNGPVDEGAAYLLSLTGVSDPSTADTSAGFQYAFDCGTGYGAFASTPTRACAASGSGVLSVRGKVRDKDGGEREYVASMTVIGVPPVITVPAGVNAAATGPQGATVTFDASAHDAFDGPVAVNCAPGSGSTFGLGTTTVSCVATDLHGNTAEPITFTVTVTDQTPPALTVTNVVAEATGPNGAAVAFTATAIDAVDALPTVTCSVAGGPVAPGAVFPIGVTPVSCVATDAAGNSSNAGFSVTVRDTTAPVVSYSGNAGTYTPDQTINIQCTAADSATGISSSTCQNITGPAYAFALGTNTFSATATDGAGNIGTGTTSFKVVSTPESIQILVSRLSTNAGVAQGLNAKLAAAAQAPNANARAGQLNAFANQVHAQTGKALTTQQAAILLQLAAALQ